MSTEKHFFLFLIDNFLLPCVCTNLQSLKTESTTPEIKYNNYMKKKLKINYKNLLIC